jgi:hypothetical protein
MPFKIMERCGRSWVSQYETASAAQPTVAACAPPSGDDVVRHAGRERAARQEPFPGMAERGEGRRMFRGGHGAPHGIRGDAHAATAGCAAEVVSY